MTCLSYVADRARLVLCRAPLPLLLLSSLSAYADGTYIEGRGGRILKLQDLAGQGDIDSAIGFARLTGTARGNVSYDNTFLLGAEVGVEDVFGTSLRISGAVDVFEPEVNSAVLAAAGGQPRHQRGRVPEPPDGSPLGSDALADLGLNFSHRTATLSGNAFVDLDISGFTPYVGAGYAVLLVENTKPYETGLLLHAGFRVDLTPMFYLGGKVSWFRGDGPQDDTGIDFDTFETTSAAGSVGIRL